MDVLAGHARRPALARCGAALTCGPGWSLVLLAAGLRLGPPAARRRGPRGVRRAPRAAGGEVHPVGHDAGGGAPRRAAAVGQRDAGSRGDSPDERRPLDRRTGPGSPLRAAAAPSRPRLLGRGRRHARARDRRDDGGLQRHARGCCWRRCRMRSRTGSCASISRNRGSPTRDAPCRRRSSGCCAARPPHSPTSARATSARTLDSTSRPTAVGSGCAS